MKSQQDKHDKTSTSKTAASLEAPLSLPADQLELVAGGLMPTTLALRPVINGLIRVPQ
jgi:hypothetical protein